MTSTARGPRSTIKSCKRRNREKKTVPRFPGAVRMIPILIASAALTCGQTLPSEPAHDAGTTVTGAFEGWFKNPDGTFGLLLGYYNRNRNQEVDIPIGPDNRI